MSNKDDIVGQMYSSNDSYSGEDYGGEETTDSDVYEVFAQEDFTNKFPRFNSIPSSIQNNIEETYNDEKSTQQSGSKPYSHILSLSDQLYTPPPRQSKSLLNLGNLTSPGVEVMYPPTSALDMFANTKSCDQMIVLFCVLIGYNDIEEETIAKYKELNHRLKQNVRIGPPKKYMVCNYYNSLLNVLTKMYS